MPSPETAFPEGYPEQDAGTLLLQRMPVSNIHIHFRRNLFLKEHLHGVPGPWAVYVLHQKKQAEGRAG